MAIVYSSLKDDFAGKKAFFNAQNAAVSFKELRGKTVEIANVVITEDDVTDIDILGPVEEWPEPVAVKVGTAKSGRGREYTTVSLA